MSLVTRDVEILSDRFTPGFALRGPVGGGEAMVLRSPWDGAELARVPTTTADDLDAVLDRARLAFESFRWTPAWRRAQILERASHLIEENAEQIARLIANESGKPLKDARIEASRGASTFRWAAEESKRTAGEIIEMDAEASGEHRFGWTIREPRGVIAAISPFNFPLNLAAHKVAPALAAANIVVLKPASQTPLTALRLAELLVEAGLPEHVPRARQQLGHHRRRGRPPRPRRAAHRGRGLRELRAGVHLGAARGRAPEGLRRVHGQARAGGRGAQARRPARREHRRLVADLGGRGRARAALG
ncbi:MAG: aldehyde dehydrogenase family protein, partial [Solirubrobacteraceae bacterium]|nr:aldehyde dehydrogenase family protein [Solirubrobacteraceae bacterium]